MATSAKHKRGIADPRGKPIKRNKLEFVDAPDGTLCDWRGLTPLQQRLVHYYLICDTAREAGARAGMTGAPDVISASVSRMLEIPAVQRAIAESRTALAKKYDVSADRVIQELSRIAFAQHADPYNVDGSLKSPHEMGPDIGATIASVEIDELWTGVGEERVQVGVTKKIKRHDKIEALKALAKHLGLTPDRVKHSGTIDHKHAHGHFDLDKLPLEMRKQIFAHIQASQTENSGEAISNIPMLKVSADGAIDLSGIDFDSE